MYPAKRSSKIESPAVQCKFLYKHDKNAETHPTPNSMLASFHVLQAWRAVRMLRMPTIHSHALLWEQRKTGTLPIKTD